MITGIFAITAQRITGAGIMIL